MSKPAQRTFLGSMIKLGLIGFGGGSALIPLFEAELVDRKKILTEDEFVQHTVVANVTPGALPVKLGALAGAKIGTPALSLGGAFATIFPGVTITIALLASFAAIGPAAVRYVEYAAIGISAFILVQIWRYLRKVYASAKRPLVIAAVIVAAFLATGASQAISLAGHLFATDLTVNVPRLDALGLIVATVAILIVGGLLRPGPKTASPGDALTPSGRLNINSAIWFGLLSLAAMVAGFLLTGTRGLKFLSLITGSTLTSFGGGAAYIGVADSFFVHSGLVPGAQFYGQIVPVANGMPGTIILKIAGGLGYGFGLENGGPWVGLGMAIAAVVVAASSCAAIALAIMAGYDRFAHSTFIRRLGTYIPPVICGLLVTTACSMVNASITIATHANVPRPIVGWGTFVLVAAMLLAFKKWRLGDLPLILAGGGLTLALLLAV